MLIKCQHHFTIHKSANILYIIYHQVTKFLFSLQPTCSYSEKKRIKGTTVPYVIFTFLAFGAKRFSYETINQCSKGYQAFLLFRVGKMQLSIKIYFQQLARADFHYDFNNTPIITGRYRQTNYWSMRNYLVNFLCKIKLFHELKALLVRYIMGVEKSLHLFFNLLSWKSISTVIIITTSL